MNTKSNRTLASTAATTTTVCRVLLRSAVSPRQWCVDNVMIHHAGDRRAVIG